MKYICYSLWGSSRLYCQGLLENLKLAPKIYPDFKVRVYIAENCPVLKDLIDKDCEVVVMPAQTGIDRSKEDWVWQADHTAMFWRSFIIDELKEGDLAIFRDADSRLSEREAIVVYDWIGRSPYLACRIAENASHWNSFCMSGMFGIKGGTVYGVRESVEAWIEHYKTLNHPWIFVDLEWNTNVLGPIIQNQTIGYGYGHRFPLPELKEGEMAIGDVVNPDWRGEIYE